MSWYRTGTVAVTNGSKTVTGVGTLFTTAVNVGDAFALVDANLNPTGAWYEVEAVVSNTEITLKQTYAGTTGGNNQYCVFNMVGNMTTPSFAQRLATFFASFQTLLDKPTSTPTALGIPVADANGDIDSGWIKDASATVKGVVKVGTNLGVVDGVISVPEATETVKGVVELATSAEAAAGNDTTRAITPSVSGSRITFATTSTNDATSATAAPLKTAGGLAVAKRVFIGTTDMTSQLGGINMGSLRIKSETFTLEAGDSKEINCYGGIIAIFVPAAQRGGLFFVEYYLPSATKLAGSTGEVTDTGTSFAILGSISSATWQLKNRSAGSVTYRVFSVNI